MNKIANFKNNMLYGVLDNQLNKLYMHHEKND